ncbi:MAG: HAD family hydrolase [Lachnospiraceae bacterium]|nr:HAD family hydrolase [Lachnospiraceae bacterium]
MKVESLIFDMDGTLWDSSENVAAAWNVVIEKQPDVNITLTGEDIKKVMGLPMDAIAARFFREVNPVRQMQIMNECGDYENEYLLNHGGRLYDGLEDVLKELSKEHRLFIVSNCQSGYIEAFLDYYGFEKYFTAIKCWGDNELSKGENIKLIMKENDVTDAAYVGDIQGDCDSTYYAGAKFIHAAYGFGDVDRCDARIDDIRDLPKLLNE